MATFIYHEIEKALRDEILSGQRAPGSKMPSIRELCKDRSVSKSTAIKAYQQLESELLIESRPRSGYYVCRKTEVDKTSGALPSGHDPVFVNFDEVLVDIMDRGAPFDILPGVPRADDNDELKRCMARAFRQQTSYEAMYYDDPDGLPALRREIARHVQRGGGNLSQDDIVVTNGCQHALMIALMATAKAGDTVVVEAPAFYGVFQAIEALGLRCIEVPSLAECDSNLGLLEATLNRWQPAAFVCFPNFATPTGSIMPEATKAATVALCHNHGVAIIEDDIYGELYFGLSRPRTLYSYCDNGNVLLCSSFSKSLSRDLRIGWLIPGKHINAARRLKIASSISISQSVQKGIAQYMIEGHLQRWVGEKRSELSQRVAETQMLIANTLPTVASVSTPAGGLSLWVEFDPSVDTLMLYKRLRGSDISITPGGLFSVKQRFGHCIRLSFEHPWTADRINALRAIGAEITALSATTD
ncbi:HTH-type transcriptional regulator NorG [BD1-7 clade bacterium]|uniref:HTH-type transcriptional regulator NorG n=1 Tax=BD1-7 clade bacterium TaxID=2029982 RepID=A0A5S9QY91_9GAMM|nr:HTH-type transcriptional regulator NorG [BD1-7 clade bacterium]